MGFECGWNGFRAQRSYLQIDVMASSSLNLHAEHECSIQVLRHKNKVAYDLNLCSSCHACPGRPSRSIPLGDKPHFAIPRTSRSIPAFWGQVRGSCAQAASSRTGRIRRTAQRPRISGMSAGCEPCATPWTRPQKTGTCPRGAKPARADLTSASGVPGARAPGAARPERSVGVTLPKSDGFGDRALCIPVLRGE